MWISQLRAGEQAAGAKGSVGVLSRSHAARGAFGALGLPILGGHTIGPKRSILIEILGLPLAVRVDPAKPHDVRVGRELLADH